MENRVIFESEKQYIDFMNDIIPDSIVSKWSIIKNSGECAKQKGYIRKSIVEEVEDYFRIFKMKDYNLELEKEFMRDVIISMNLAIQHLKSELKTIKEARG